MEPIKKDFSSFNLDNIKENQQKSNSDLDNKTNQENKVYLQGKKNLQSFDTEKNKNEKLNKNIKTNPLITSKIEPEISEKSEGLYDCSHRQRDLKSGGFFYYFELKKEFQNLDDVELRKAEELVNEKLYPAIQLIFIYNESIYEIYTQLGYKLEYCDSFVLPDETIINYRYKEMQQQNPDLPNLEIISTEDNLTDKLFIDLTKKGKILLSKGHQFIHDHTAHVITRIELLYFCDKLSFDLVMKQFENTVDRIINIIESETSN
ncbi:MAG: hypothetical protein Q8K60_03780, partial [Parachlamydiaceae bacterium]|nr:hypothetical protein [Parachlamydiaceae bacterium]